MAQGDTTVRQVDAGRRRPADGQAILVQLDFHLLHVPRMRPLPRKVQGTDVSAYGQPKGQAKCLPDSALRLLARSRDVVFAGLRGRNRG